MDPVSNPYAPGAGQRPPELAGREAELRTFEVLLERVSRGRPDRSIVLTGLRGVGKTVLLNALRGTAVRQGWGTGKLEARPDQSLRQPLAAALHLAIRELPRPQRGRDAARPRRAEGVRAARAGGPTMGRRAAKTRPWQPGHRGAGRGRTGRLRRHRDRSGRAVHRPQWAGRRHRQGARGLHRRDAGPRARRRLGPVRGLPRDQPAEPSADRRRSRAAPPAGRALGEQVLLRAAVPLRPHRSPRPIGRRRRAAGAGTR